MAGQVYTALSRASDPQYLHIINFPYKKIRCADKVVDFYQTLSSASKETKIEKKEEETLKNR